MRTKGYQDYLEDEVLSANPLKLVRLLYQGALDSIASARRSLQEGNIRARSRSIDKAMAIVRELSGTLRHEQGGEISRTLAELYDYVQKLLIRANVEQIDPPLAEAERLLNVLLEAWQTCEPQAGFKEAVVGEAQVPRAAAERVCYAF